LILVGDLKQVPVLIYEFDDNIYPGKQKTAGSFLTLPLEIGFNNHMPLKIAFFGQSLTNFTQRE
jgi:hypothetical protein